METLKSIFSQFMDKELLIIIGCIIVALILLRVLGNFLSRHRILKIAVIGIIFVLLIIGIFWLIDNRRDLYSNNATKYVTGEVKNISSAVRKVEVKVISSNVTYGKVHFLNDRTVVVDIDMNCKFLDNKGNEISFNDIGFYDTVQIYVKENNIDDDLKETLSGVKLILKNDYSKDV